MPVLYYTPAMPMTNLHWREETSSVWSPWSNRSKSCVTLAYLQARDLLKVIRIPVHCDVPDILFIESSNQIRVFLSNSSTSASSSLPGSSTLPRNTASRVSIKSMSQTERSSITMVLPTQSIGRLSVILPNKIVAPINPVSEKWMPTMKDEICLPTMLLHRSC